MTSKDTSPADHPSTESPRINLALQGGGSHGAFTWGVLDALLEDGRIGFEGISGTSAGAMNAVVLAHGLASAQGQPRAAQYDAAREALAKFWNGIVDMGAMFGQSSNTAWPGASWGQDFARLWGSQFSPYQSNPFDINPLRKMLESQVDFARLASSTHAEVPKVFVVATRVKTGKAEVFSGKHLSADAVMASACLPMVFKAVEIAGEPYWDGGYAGNPSLHPLIYQCQSRDIMLVQINPIARDELPTSPGDIADRVNEITFNACLVAEMRAIDFVKRLLAEGKLDPAHYKDVLMHRIDGGEALEKYPASTKGATGGKLIHELRDLGVKRARAWLGRHFADVGQECTVNIARDYLDDLRVPVAPKAASA